MNRNLLSSITKKGKYVTQIVHFMNGYRKTIHEVDTHSIEEGKFTKFKVKDGRMILVNEKNVLMIEVFEED